MTRNFVQLTNHGHSSRYFIARIVIYLLLVLRKLLSLLKALRSMMVRPKTRRFLLWLIFLCLAFTALLFLKFLDKSPFRFCPITANVQGCAEENIVYIDGRIECHSIHKGRYLSYQPPGGGWNNQRVAFENAVVLAKFLNRTLIVHPLAPHQEILNFRKQQKIVAGPEIYNMFPKDKLLALSNVIDLRLLSRLVPVKEFASSHAEFHRKYNTLKWAKVCHNGLLGIWVDFVPKKTDKEKWDLLQQYMLSLPSPKEIPIYRRKCEKETEHFKGNFPNSRPVWGIIDELSNRTEDLIYFSEGSLYNRKFIFFDEEEVLNAHQWIMQFVHFAPYIRNRAKAVLEKLKHPFNAIHVRRTDHPSSFRIKHDYWLSRLKNRAALNVTKTLYIATDEKNRTWFRPFREAGFNLYFAEDFADQLQIKSIPAVIIQDVLGLCEQLICAHADHFVGSYYSTFTMYIKRLRKQLSWKRGMLQDTYTSIIWAGSLDRGR
ncbi:uncharacterized protein [Montipora foliosa]|uniref:uncharacterized protein n=1 Tax=Montipora foliosa TaxID=591990 RepID=UPI0035F191C0